MFRRESSLCTCWLSRQVKIQDREYIRTVYKWKNEKLEWGEAFSSFASHTLCFAMLLLLRVQNEKSKWSKKIEKRAWFKAWHGIGVSMKKRREQVSEQTRLTFSSAPQRTLPYVRFINVYVCKHYRASQGSTRITQHLRCTMSAYLNACVYSSANMVCTRTQSQKHSRNKRAKSVLQTTSKRDHVKRRREDQKTVESAVESNWQCV